MTGNASTATALQTARTINGVAFDGTANITIADSTKEPGIAAGTSAQVWYGDKVWRNVADMVISTATQNALNLKASLSGASFTGTVSATNAASSAVMGTSTSSDGVYGNSSSGYGVRGTSSTAAGVYGGSTSTHGVVGKSYASSSAGVIGYNYNDTVYGILGYSNYAVYAGGQSYFGGPVRIDSGSSSWVTMGSATVPSSYSVYYRGGGATGLGYIGSDGGGATGGGVGANMCVRALNRLLLASDGYVVAPNNDALTYIGYTDARWAAVYAATGAIQTSDARVKTAISPLTEAELGAAKALAKEIGTYQFLESVKSKGDKARLHPGFTVQRAIEIMESFGLDPFRYGFICHDTWEAQKSEATYNEDGTVRCEAVDKSAGDLYSFRYDELNIFIARGLETRLSEIEDRVAVLETVTK